MVRECKRGERVREGRGKRGERVREDGKRV